MESYLLPTALGGVGLAVDGYVQARLHCALPCHAG